METAPFAPPQTPRCWLGTDVQDDPVARCLLQRAQGTLQKWPEGFRGFRAKIRCRTTGRDAVGTVYVKAGGQIEVLLADPYLGQWVEPALRGVAEERTPRFFKDGDGRFPITLGDADGHPLGRLVQVHRPRGEGLAYRIDMAGRIRQEERTHRGLRVLITLEEFARATPGRVLPVRVTRACWDLRTGTRLRSEVLKDTHCRLEHVWLPETRTATIGGSDRIETFLLQLERHTPL